MSRLAAGRRAGIEDALARLRIEKLRRLLRAGVPARLSRPASNPGSAFTSIACSSTMLGRARAGLGSDAGREKSREGGITRVAR